MTSKEQKHEKRKQITKEILLKWIGCIEDMDRLDNIFKVVLKMYVEEMNIH